MLQHQKVMAGHMWTIPGCLSGPCCLMHPRPAGNLCSVDASQSHYAPMHAGVKIQGSLAHLGATVVEHVSMTELEVNW
jgi:hypothetical protein